MVETTTETTNVIKYQGAAEIASGGDIFKSQAYELSADEINDLTRLSYEKQSNQGEKGIAAEASLIANVLEIYSKYGETINELYSSRYK